MAEEHAQDASDAAESAATEREKTPEVHGMAPEVIAQIIEAALLAAEGPLTVDNLFRLFSVGELDEEEGRKQIRTALETLQEACHDRGVTLQRVSSGYRYQTRQDLSPWVSRLWEEKPPRYTRALLETLALVAYKQPVTRGDIEQVRGVSVSQNIMRTLLERDWIRVVGAARGARQAVHVRHHQGFLRLLQSEQAGTTAAAGRNQSDARTDSGGRRKNCADSEFDQGRNCG